MLHIGAAASTFWQNPESTQSVYAFDTPDEESDTPAKESNQIRTRHCSAQLKALIEADNAASMHTMVTFQTATINCSSSIKRGKLSECVSNPLRDNDSVKRQRFTHAWPGIRLFFSQPLESSKGTSLGVQPLVGKK